MLRRPNLLIDALFNVHTSSGASDDYAHGLVVGVMSTLMAVTEGRDFDELLPIVTKHLPISFRPDRLPEAWRDDFVAERNRQIEAKRRECAARKG